MQLVDLGVVRLRNESRIRSIAYATAMPEAVPNTASNALSTKTCESIRPREPLIASRSANSEDRADVRDSSRVARFAHAISRTTSDTASRIDAGLASFEED